MHRNTSSTFYTWPDGLQHHRQYRFCKTLNISLILTFKHSHRPWKTTCTLKDLTTMRLQSAEHSPVPNFLTLHTSSHVCVVLCRRMCIRSTVCSSHAAPDATYYFTTLPPVIPWRFSSELTMNILLDHYATVESTTEILFSKKVKAHYNKLIKAFKTNSGQFYWTPF